MTSDNCARRIHRWKLGGAKGGRVCLDCGHIEGKRARRGSIAVTDASLAPRPPELVVASRPEVVVDPTVAGLPSGDALAARRARLATRFAPQVTAVNAPEQSAVPPEQSAVTPEQPAVTPEEKVLIGDLADLLGPLIPSFVVELEKKIILRGGHVPNEPNPDIQERFEKCVITFVRLWAPKLEMSPGWGAVVTGAALYASMRIGADKVEVSSSDEAAKGKEKEKEKDRVDIKGDASVTRLSQEISVGNSVSTQTGRISESSKNGGASNVQEPASVE